MTEGSLSGRGVAARMHPIKGFVGATAFLALSCIGQSALAQDDASINNAYEMSAQGLSAYNSGKYAEALAKFTSAYAIVKLPALAVHMARADVKLGKLTAAAELYQVAGQLGDGVGDHQIQSRARAEATQERAALLLRIPKLFIRIRGAKADAVTVSVDGTRVPPESFESGSSLDPGMHKVVAVFGNQTKEQSTSLAEGEAREVRLAFESAAPLVPFVATNHASEAAPAPMSATRTAAWTSFGIGGAGLLLFGTSGIVALSKSEHFKSIPCGQPGQVRCDPSERDSYNTWRTIAGVGFYTGVAGLVTGAALYFAEPSQKKTRESSARMLPWVGVGSAGIEGSF